MYFGIIKYLKTDCVNDFSLQSVNQPAPWRDTATLTAPNDNLLVMDTGAELPYWNSFVMDSFRLVPDLYIFYWDVTYKGSWC